MRASRLSLQFLASATFLLAIAGANNETVMLTGCELKCDLPQIRSVYLWKLFNFSYNFLPQATVLHRCDEGTGCCDNRDSVCKVSKLEAVEITVLVRYPNTKIYTPETLTVYNHTQCFCQNNVNDIK